MGQMIEFAANGDTGGGYLAGTGPGVLVLQEWWGLVPQIKGVCNRLAEEGFTALAPDLFHGEIAEHDEMDKAGHLMSSLPADEAARDMSAAIDELLTHCTGDAVGVVGFCMGGMLTFRIAALEGDRVAAAVPFYGALLGEDETTFTGLTAAVQGHFAEDDAFFPADACVALGDRLRSMGREISITVYPGTGHGFTNEENPIGNFDEAATAIAWASTLDFLRENL
jgi:carboxymethylenebutenolidase